MITVKNVGATLVYFFALPKYQLDPVEAIVRGGLDQGEEGSFSVNDTVSILFAFGTNSEPAAACIAGVDATVTFYSESDIAWCTIT